MFLFLYYMWDVLYWLSVPQRISNRVCLAVHTWLCVGHTCVIFVVRSGIQLAVESSDLLLGENSSPSCSLLN